MASRLDLNSFGHDIGLHLPRIKSKNFFDAGPGDTSIETCQRFCCSHHVLRESWKKAIDLDSFSRRPPHSKRVTWVYIKTHSDPNTSSFLYPFIIMSMFPSIFRTSVYTVQSTICPLDILIPPNDQHLSIVSVVT